MKFLTILSVALVMLIKIHSIDAYQILSEFPRIFLIENFLTSEECDYIITQATPALLRSTVLSEQNGTVDHRRTSHGMFFPSHHIDPVLKKIEERISQITQMPIENGEGLQVLRYRIGGEYQPHHDYFVHSQPGGTAALSRGGQRVASLIMYLNTPEKGGETIFPLAGVSVSPKKGTALLFYNVTPAGLDDPQSLHGGAPVVAGEKWIATKWLREGVFR